MAPGLLDRTVVRFLLTGVVNTLVGAGAMFLLYNVAHCSYWVSSAVNYVLGGTLSFVLNKWFTFRSREWSWGEVARFVLNVAVCWLIAYGAAKPLALWLLAAQSEAVQENIALLVGMCLYTALNYIGQKFFTFR